MMTTGNKQWAIGRAVERALSDRASFTVYQHVDESNDWAVRSTTASEPRKFKRRYMVTCANNTAMVHPYRQEPA